MSALLVALLGVALLTQPSADAAMQTLLTADDGGTAQHILTTDPDDEQGATWIDGHGSVRRDE